jgi:hypothetical protein
MLKGTIVATKKPVNKTQKAQSSADRYSKEAEKQDKRANELASWSYRVLAGQSFFGGKKALDAGEASRKKRLAMADEQAQYARENAARAQKEAERLSSTPAKKAKPVRKK